MPTLKPILTSPTVHSIINKRMQLSVLDGWCHLSQYPIYSRYQYTNILKISLYHPFPYQCFLLVGMQGLGFGALDSVSLEAHGIFYPICQSDSQKYWGTIQTGDFDSLIIHTWHLQCKSLYLGARVTVPEVAEMVLYWVIILWVSRLFSYPDGKTSVWVWDCEWTGHAHSK